MYYNNRGQEVQEINYDYPEGNKVETFTEYYDNGLIKSQYECLLLRLRCIFYSKHFLQ